MRFCTHQSCSRLLSVSHRSQNFQQPALAINICEVLQAVLHEDNALILASSAPCCGVEPRRCRKHGLCCVCKSNRAYPLDPANGSFLRRGNRCNNGKKEGFFFLTSYQSHSPTGTNNHRAARGAVRRLRAASVLPGDSEFTLERKLLKLLVYIYPTHDRTRFKFWKLVRRSPTVGGKVRLRLSAQTRWSLFSGWIKSFYSSSC